MEPEDPLEEDDVNLAAEGESLDPEPDHQQQNAEFPGCARHSPRWTCQSILKILAV